jgi:hypothetical protein
VHAVQTKALGKNHMGVDHQSHIVPVRHVAYGIGGTQDQVFVAGGQRQADTGDVLGIQNAGQIGGNG